MKYNFIITMKSKSYTILKQMITLMVFLTIASMQVTYATPPAIVPAHLINITLANSSTVHRSERLEGLQFIPGAGKTDLRIRKFNRSQSGMHKTYNLQNLTGSWQLFHTNPKSFSCFLIKEQATNNISFVQFDDKNNIFRIVFTITQPQVRTRVPLSEKNNTLFQFRDRTKFGNDCRLINFYDRIYRLNEVNNSLVLIPGTDLNNWVLSSAAPSLNYVIAGNRLFKYSWQNNVYNEIFTFSDNYQNYQITDSDNRLIISSWNSSVINSSITGMLSNGTNITGTAPIIVIRQNFKAFLDSNTAGLTLINQFTINAFDADLFSPRINEIYSNGLTKLAFRYFNYVQGQATQILGGRIVIKSFDYTRMAATNIRFADEQSFYQIMVGIRGRNHFYLSDYFFVVRNHSLCFNNASVNCKQRCYQFVGDKLIEIGRRTLTDAGEISDSFDRVFIDETFTLNAIVLTNIMSATGFKVTQINYYNYAAITRIVQPPTPSFLEAFAPNGTDYGFDSGNLESSFVSINLANMATTITAYRFSSTFSTTNSNVNTYTNVLPNGPFIKAASQHNCSIYVSFANPLMPSVVFLELKEGQSSFQASPLIAPQILSIGQINLNTQIRLGSSCQRLMVNRTIFYRTSTTWNKVQNNQAQFAWSSMDENLTYAVVNDSIWKYNPATFRYVVYYTHTSPFFTETRAVSYDNRLCIISHQNAPPFINVSAFAFVDTPTGLRMAFNFTDWFVQAYIVEISDSLDAVVIAGYKVNPAAPATLYPQIYLKWLNYATLSTIDLNFPWEVLRQIQVPEMILFDRFMYIRQKRDLDRAATNTTYATKPHEEFVYYYDNTNVPKLIFNRKLTDDDARKWARTMFKIYPNKNLILQLQRQILSNGTRVILRSYQLSVERASVNIDGGFVQNGKVKACIHGCTSCTSETQCTTCGKLGFVLDTNTKRCVQCAPGCTSCEADRPVVCSACLNGTYLSGSTCLSCNRPCLTCSNSANSCTSCIPGRRFNSTSATCQNCTLKNCLSCDSGSGNCLVCRPGFVLANSRCRGCAGTCSSCNPANITQCTGCKNGLKLLNGTCVSCPVNCLTCNDQLACQQCRDGYYAKNGACVINCVIPCATCSDNQPKSCTSCFGTDILEGSTCKIDLSCNTTSTCTSCGESQASNLYWENGNCYSCSKNLIIQNCIQCNGQNPLVCSICSNGYYLSQGSCLACNSDCLKCLSSSVCQVPAEGYTLSQGGKAGLCTACQSPCATCKDSPTSCLTCVSGFTKRSWKCQKNNFAQFKIVLNAANGTPINVEFALGKVDDIITRLLILMNENVNNLDAITIYTVKSGSVAIQGSATATSGTSAETSALLSAGLTNGAFGTDFSLASSSVTTVSLDGSAKESDKTGLIVGVTIGSIVAVVLIVGFLTYCLYYKKRAQMKVENIENPSHIQIHEEKKINNQILSNEFQ